MSAKRYSKSALWIRYADVFNLLGGMPVNGSPSDADCAIALSFGRNNVPDNRLPDVRDLFDDLQGNNLETIERIGHAYFGDFDPGLPNVHIAQHSALCMIKFNIPLLAQWEIPMAMYQRSGIQWMTNALANQKLFCLWPPNRPAYRSIEVLEDAYRITQEKGWKRPILLAHDYHMPRVAMLARHFWPEFIIGFPTITRTFDPKAIQLMTTSPRRWYEYEIKSRSYHFLYGYCFGHFRKGRF